MRFSPLFQALPTVLLFASTQGTPFDDYSKRQTSLDSFVTSETTVAINGVLANIGADGSKAQGAAAGIVVASPSKTSPDCKPIHSSVSEAGS